MQTTIKWYDPIDHVIVQMCQTIQIHYIYKAKYGKITK